MKHKIRVEVEGVRLLEEPTTYYTPTHCAVPITECERIEEEINVVLRECPGGFVVEKYSAIDDEIGDNSVCFICEIIGDDLGFPEVDFAEKFDGWLLSEEEAK